MYEKEEGGRERRRDREMGVGSGICMLVCGGQRRAFSALPYRFLPLNLELNWRSASPRDPHISMNHSNRVAGMFMAALDVRVLGIWMQTLMAANSPTFWIISPALYELSKNEDETIDSVVKYLWPPTTRRPELEFPSFLLNTFQTWTCVVIQR